MKQLKPYLFNLTLSLFLSASCYLSAQTNSTLNDYQQVKSSVSASPTIGVIDTRKCLEESKLSKHERVALEKMKAKMESVLKEKQKAVAEIENKLRDEDYMDSVSDDLERELKHKRRVLTEEGMELSRQFTENLEAANMKLIQTVIEAIGAASKEVATEMGQQNKSLDIILSNEACTYFSPHLDVTSQILAKMDHQFETTKKEEVQK